MKNLLIIGAGGAIGSIGRYLVQVWADRYLTLRFPVGTLMVNFSGCLLIGLLYGLSLRNGWFTFEWRIFLITGICGGYTTFSSFAYESISLVREGQLAAFFLYVGGSVILGLLATVIGIMVVR
jgi:CrcB protein